MHILLLWESKKPFHVISTSSLIRFSEGGLKIFLRYFIELAFIDLSVGQAKSPEFSHGSNGAPKRVNFELPSQRVGGGGGYKMEWHKKHI